MVRLIAAIMLLAAGASAQAVIRTDVDNPAVVVGARGLARLSATAVPGTEANAVPAMALMATNAPLPLVPPVRTPAEAVDDLLPDGLTLMILALGLALFGVILRRRVPTVSA